MQLQPLTILAQKLYFFKYRYQESQPSLLPGNCLFEFTILFFQLDKAMNISDVKAANALGGKTARACDSCLRKRACWFCPTYDAFLYQACDASVHSANQPASRYERVQLETSSFKGSEVMNSSPPAWHQGFTRKARTPRHAKAKWLQTPSHHSLPLVPEINGEDPFSEENEEQLLYRVPVLDPFVNEFCTEMGNVEEADCEGDLNLAEFLSCDAELVEFAADVESLLGKGIEEDSGCGINNLDGNRMKVEDEDKDEAVIACHFDPTLDMELNWDFDYASFAMDGEDMKKVGSIGSMENIESGSESQVKKKLLLRLNYEAVMEDWATQGSPWTNGVRPHEFNLDEFKIAWLDGSVIRYEGRLGGNDAGREARVSRYREKRRTRLFSKKIRYQVRKLNAEKRPRMKGRFVKRTGIGPCGLMNKL